MSDSRIIIFSLIVICVTVMVRPPVNPDAKEILLFILGGLLGYMRREPQYQQLPPPPPTAQGDTTPTQELK